MAKWFGKIGYIRTDKTESGIYEPSAVERSYYGDLISDRRNRQDSGGVNSNINLSNTISILADPFAVENCSYMAYAEVMGAKWKITNVEIQYPRLLLTVGGLYK